MIQTPEPPAAASRAAIGHPAVAQLAAGVENALPDLVPAAVEAIWQQVPAYAASHDDQLRADVGVHVAAVFRVFLDGLAGRREAGRADLTDKELTQRRLAPQLGHCDC